MRKVKLVTVCFVVGFFKENFKHQVKSFLYFIQSSGCKTSCHSHAGCCSCQNLWTVKSWLTVHPCSLSNNISLDSRETEILKIDETRYHHLNWRNQILLFYRFNSFYILCSPNETSRDNTNFLFTFWCSWKKLTKEIKILFSAILTASDVSQCWLCPLWEIWYTTLEVSFEGPSFGF